MEKRRILVLVGAIVALGVVVWLVFRGTDDERAIRERIDRLARAVHVECAREHPPAAAAG